MCNERRKEYEEGTAQRDQRLINMAVENLPRVTALYNIQYMWSLWSLVNLNMKVEGIYFYRISSGGVEKG
jgi:hypothetical protein